MFKCTICYSTILAREPRTAHYHSPIPCQSTRGVGSALTPQPRTAATTTHSASFTAMSPLEKEKGFQQLQAYELEQACHVIRPLYSRARKSSATRVHRMNSDPTPTKVRADTRVRAFVRKCTGKIRRFVDTC